MKAIQHVGIYLLVQEFSIETDHKSLTHLHTSKHLNGRVMRWALLLQPYTFTTRYRPGARNGNADALSRQAWLEQERPTSLEEGGVRPQP